MSSCTLCGTKYNFFHKEVGCANCGLSFCGKCVRHKSKIPSKGNEEFNVCKKCYIQLSSGEKSQDVFIPPAAFIKRLEMLENPAAPPITVYRHDPKIEKLRSGLSPADQKLLERLEKLKDTGKGPPPSDSELMARLRVLKGEPEEGQQSQENEKSKIYFKPDTRTDQEKADGLLERYMEERVIDAEAYDSEEEVNRITKRVQEEVDLDEQSNIKSLDKYDDEEEKEEGKDESEELPWCVLCNNDAKYRCLDCSGDLYCSSCNIEVHKNWGDTDHHVVPYKPKK